MSGPIQIPVAFTGAGERDIQIRGRFVLVTDATDTVYLKFDHGSELTYGKHSNIDFGREFSVITVRSAVAQTVILTLSDEKQDEGRDNVTVTVSATLTPGNTWDNTTDHAPAGAGVTELVIAADATTLAFSLTNPSTNTGTMRAAGTAAGAGIGKGTPIEPGQSISRAYNGNVYVYFPVAGESVTPDTVRKV